MKGEYFRFVNIHLKTEYERGELGSCHTVYK